MLAQRVEEARIQDQLAFPLHPALHAPAQLARRETCRRLLELHRGVEGPQQRQAAHVAHEHAAARRHGAASRLQNPHEVVGAGKVLRHRVEDHRVEAPGLDAREVVRLPHLEQDLRQVLATEPVLDVIQGRAREVGRVVARAVRREPEQQQPGAAADLEHAAAAWG